VKTAASRTYTISSFGVGHQNPGIALAVCLPMRQRYMRSAMRPSGNPGDFMTNL
jgi:hypothetical protein